MGVFNTFNKIVEDPDRSRFSKVVEPATWRFRGPGAGLHGGRVLVLAALAGGRPPVGLAITLSFSSWYGTPRHSARARRRLALEEQRRDEARQEAGFEDTEAETRIEALIEGGDLVQGQPDQTTPAGRAAGSLGQPIRPPTEPEPGTVLGGNAATGTLSAMKVAVVQFETGSTWPTTVGGPPRRSGKQPTPVPTWWCCPRRRWPPSAAGVT